MVDAWLGRARLHHEQALPAGPPCRAPAVCRLHVPRPRELHPFDAFFSQAAEKYRVVRQEELDGRTVTVVDVMVPLAEGANTKLGYRAWLDLARARLPLKLAHGSSSSRRRPTVSTAPKPAR